MEDFASEFEKCLFDFLGINEQVAKICFGSELSSTAWRSENDRITGNSAVIVLRFCEQSMAFPKLNMENLFEGCKITYNKVRSTNAYSYKEVWQDISLSKTISPRSGFPSSRINYSPVTKDFRGGESMNESIDYFFSSPCLLAGPLNTRSPKGNVKLSLLQYEMLHHTIRRSRSMITKR